MYRALIIIFALLWLVRASVHAQPDCDSQRYIADLFTVQVTQEPEIFATSPAIPAVYLGENVTTLQDLSFDFYEPLGDSVQDRPLIIMAFGGAFLTGDKRQAELVNYCEAMSRKGYCVASIDYRLNFNIFSTSSSIRAVYRGLQDFKAAVRYFRHHAGTYRIDPNLIIAGGNSAGAINALHSAYVDEVDRSLTSIFAATFGSPGVPDLGCTECSGNALVESGVPNVVMNLWGGIGDTTWVEGGEAPVISFHGLDDTTVSPNTASPFGFPIFPPLSGSIPIHAQADMQEIINEKHLYPGEGHELWDDAQLALEIIDSSAHFIFDQLRPQPPSILGEILTCSDSTYMYQIVDPNPDSDFCWSVTNGTIVTDSGSSIIVDWDTDMTGIIQVIELSSNQSQSDISQLDVLSDVPPQANYSFIYDGPGVAFANESIGGIAIMWDFGDGNYSSLPNPTHTYQVNGNYQAMLTITNACGTLDQIAKSVTQQCQPDLVISLDPTPSGTYQAFHSLTSDKPTLQGSSVIFKARDFVQLDVGFLINQNSTFTASLETCVN